MRAASANNFAIHSGYAAITIDIAAGGSLYAKGGVGGSRGQDGIRSNGGNAITITCSGSLTAIGGNATNGNGGDGIFAGGAGAAITITCSGSLTAIGGNATNGNGGNGIIANGAITITCDGSLTAIGGNGTVSYGNGDGIITSAIDTVTFGGTPRLLNIKGGTGGGVGYAIRCGTLNNNTTSPTIPMTRNNTTPIVYPAAGGNIVIREPGDWTTLIADPSGLTATSIITLLCDVTGGLEVPAAVTDLTINGGNHKIDTLAVSESAIQISAAANAALTIDNLNITGNGGSWPGIGFTGAGAQTLTVKGTCDIERTANGYAIGADTTVTGGLTITLEGGASLTATAANSEGIHANNVPLTINVGSGTLRATSANNRAIHSGNAAITIDIAAGGSLYAKGGVNHIGAGQDGIRSGSGNAITITCSGSLTAIGGNGTGSYTNSDGIFAGTVTFGGAPTALNIKGGTGGSAGGNAIYCGGTFTNTTGISMTNNNNTPIIYPTSTNTLTAATVNLTAPATGIASADATGGGANYTVQSTVWTETDTGTVLTTGDPFAPTTAYKAAVTLQANAGYTFGTVPVGSVTVIGGTVKSATTFGTGSGNTLQVVVEYGASKTVSVGAQSGSLTAGTTGSVTYNVTTANIANGTYTATVANLPAGGTVFGQVNISNNAGTLTLAGSATTVAGTTNNLTLTINDTVSDNFSLVVAAPQYAINVTNGTANPNPAVSGATVTLTANSPAPGKQFKQWDITPAVTFTDSTSATSSTAKFTMPAQPVAAEAIYENIPSTVTGVTVNPSSVTVQKGTSYQFSATVTGTNNPAQTVTWSVSGNIDSGTSISGGLLTVAAVEAAAALTVTATSTANTSMSGTATVTVSDNPPLTPTVTSITVTPATITLDKGDSHTFSAMVAGDNSPSQGVTWSVSPANNGSSINASGTLTVDASETAGVLTVRATSTVAPTISGTATVTVNQPVQPITYTITFNPNGGVVGETTRAITQGTAIGALPIPTRSGNYRFDGWFTAVSGGTVISAATVPTSNTIYYAQWTYTGGNNNGGGSSSDSDSGGGITSSTTAPATTWLDQSTAATLASGAKNRGENYVRTRSTGKYGVRGIAWTKLTGLQYQHDTVADGAVQVRLYISDPAKLTKDTLVSGYVKGSDVDWVKSHFEEYFKNRLRVIHLDQQGDFGQPVKIAAKVDLIGMDTKKLVFYAYDKATNTYQRIEKPAYWIDANGYLQFTTESAGDIIVSEGPLEKR